MKLGNIYDKNIRKNKNRLHKGKKTQSMSFREDLWLQSQEYSPKPLLLSGVNKGPGISAWIFSTVSFWHNLTNTENMFCVGPSLRHWNSRRKGKCFIFSMKSQSGFTWSCTGHTHQQEFWWDRDRLITTTALGGESLWIWGLGLGGSTLRIP